MRQCEESMNWDGEGAGWKQRLKHEFTPGQEYHVYLGSWPETIGAAYNLVLSKCWRHWSRKVHLLTSRESLIKECLFSGCSEAQVWRLCWREMLVLHCTEPELSIITPKVLVQTPPEIHRSFIAAFRFPQDTPLLPRRSLWRLCVVSARCDPFTHMGQLGSEHIVHIYLHLYA